jgi:hypothetical protein
MVIRARGTLTLRIVDMLAFRMEQTNAGPDARCWGMLSAFTAEVLERCGVAP